jgi:DnaJ family protein B protein 12
MEVNKEEALRCLSIAQRHRSSSNLPSALKFAKKSVSLYSTPEGEALVSSSTSTSTSESSSPAPTPNEEAGPSGAGSRSRATASGVEEHMTSAHARPGHAPKSGTTAAGGAGSGAGAAGSGSDKGKKREYTVKQMEVVKRVKTCQHHQYYEILAGEWKRRCAGARTHDLRLRSELRIASRAGC